MAANSQKIWFRLLAWLGIVLATLIVLFAVMINIARLFIPRLDNQRAYFESWLSSSFGVPVKIGHIDGHWSGFDPVLKFDDVTVEDKTGHYTVIRVDQIQVSIDLFYSFFKWQLLPGRLAVVGTKLNVYEDASGHIQVQGIVGKTQQHATDFTSLATWLATQTDIILDKINITWRDPSGAIIPVKDLTLRLRNKDDHRLQALLTLDQAVPTQLKIVAKFSQLDFARQQFTGDAYLETQQVLLSQWAKLHVMQPYLQGNRLLSGDFNGKLWMSWQSGVLSKMQALAQVDHLGVELTKTKKHLLLSKVKANALWRMTQKGWQLVVAQTETRLNGIDWPANVYQVAYQGGKDAELSAQLGYVPLSLLADISHAVSDWPKQMADLYKTLAPEAGLYNLTFKHAFHASDANQLTTDFLNLSVKPTAQYPAVSHWNGHVEVSPQAGSLQVISQDGKVNVPQAFSHPLSYQHLQAMASWQKQADGWHVVVDHVHLFDQHVNAVGRANISLVPNQPAYLDMLFGFTFANGEKISDYLPDRKLKPKVVNWIKPAFKNGQVYNGTFLLRGPAKHFPYQQHEGRFLVGFNTRDLQLHYKDGWPNLEHVNGFVEFNDASLHVDAPQAMMSGNAITHIKADIPNLKKADLTVSGQTDTDLSKAMQLLQQTPLKLGKQLQIMQVQGPSQVSVQMDIPIDHAIKTGPTVKGQVTVNGVALKLPSWGLQFTSLQGKLAFTQDALTASHMQAVFLQQPVKVNISTYKPGSAEAYFNIGLQGQVTSDAIVQQLKIPEYKHLHGKTNYQASLRIPQAPMRPIELTFLSDFRGMGLDLPDPFTKPVDTAVPTNIHIDIADKQPLAIFVRYGQQLTAALMAEQKTEGMHLTSGEIRLGKGSATQQKLPGLLITGHLQEFNWNKWAGLIDQFSGPKASATKTPPMKLRLLHLDIDRIIYNAYRLSNVDLRLQLSDFGYVLNVDSPNISGGIHIPKDLQRYKISAKLSRFYWPKDGLQVGGAAKSDAKPVPILPQDIPGLEIRCDSLRWGDRNYGYLDMLTTSNKNGIVIDKFILGDRSYSLNLTGTWFANHGVQNTRISGRIDSGSFGNLLTRWDVTRMLAETRGSVGFRLYWNDGLPYFSAKDLGGNITIDLHSGRILNLGKKTESELGLGKLLSLLSLQELPRRLALNFSDLKKGFSFDVLRGNVAISSGIAKTSDMYLNGPIAKVLLNGSVNLRDQKLALMLEVRPYLTSTLPLVATVAGGPIAGAVTWVANKIIGPTIGKAARVVFRISGPIADPKFVKVSETRGKRPKYRR